MSDAASLRKFVDDWGGHAAVDSVGFRAVREFRLRLIAQLSDVLVNPCKLIDTKFSIAKLDRTEGPVWRLVSERPEHLIDPRFESWDALLLAAADQVIADATLGGTKLADYTWGEFNTTKIQHPLSLAVPALAGWLDMPRAAAIGRLRQHAAHSNARQGRLAADGRLARARGRRLYAHALRPVGTSAVAALSRRPRRLARRQADVVLARAKGARAGAAAGWREVD